jgi:Tfp pilus assembly protein FimT
MLIELVVVVAIIAVLIAIPLPVLQIARERIFSSPQPIKPFYS